MEVENITDMTDPTLKYVIFDLDGTLVDTSADLANALTHAVSPWGRGPFDPEEVKPLVGEGIENLIKKGLGNQTSHDEVKQALARFIDHYEAHLTDNSTPYEGVAETLAKMKGIPMAVLSNKRTTMCTEILKRLDLLEHFKIVAGGDLPTTKKPHPEAMGYVLSALWAKPAEAVMVGDSALDIQAAHNVGSKSIAVTYGFRPKETLNQADVVIDRFPELIDGLVSIAERMLSNTPKQD